MSQQPMPQPYGPPPQQPPMGQLVLNLRKPFGLLSATMISPSVTVDGYPAPARWERNVFPVVAGEHTVQVESNYVWSYGAARMPPLMIRPGESVELHYSGPLLTFLAGRIGFEEQRRAGTTAFWSIIALPIVVFILLFAVAFNS